MVGNLETDAWWNEQVKEEPNKRMIGVKSETEHQKLWDILEKLGRENIEKEAEYRGDVIWSERITEAEVFKAMKVSKNGKALSGDGITSEMLKCICVAFISIMEIATDTLTMELSPPLSSVTNSLDIPIEPSPSDSGVYNSSQQVSEISDQQAAAVSEDALLMDKYSSAITNESDMPSEELEKELNVDTRENEASPIIDSSENMDDTSNKDALDNIEESSKNEDIKEIEESSNGESTENVKDSSSIDVSGDDKIPHIRGSLENCEESTMEQTEVNVETLCKNNEKDKLEESNSLELTTNDNTNSEENGKEEIHGDTVEPDLQTSDVNDETLNKEDSSTNVRLIEDSANSNTGDVQETEDSLLKDKDDGNLPDVEMAPHVEEEESMEVEDVEDDPFGGSGDKSGEGDETLEVGENSEEKKLIDDEEKADFKMDDCEQNEKEKEVDKENTPETPTVAQVAEEGEESKEGNEMEVDDDGISVADTNKDGAETETDTIVAENSTNVDKNDTEKESTEESATNEKSTEGEANSELMCADESGSTDLEANKEVGDAAKEDDEEICIIPDDIPRVMGTGNKDNLTTTTKTNAGVVNEPIKLTLAKKVSGTRSSINHNDGAEPSTSVIKRTPSRPQRQAAKKAESQIKAILQDNVSSALVCSTVIPDSSSALVCSTGILDSSSALVSSNGILDSSSALVSSTGILDSSSALVSSTVIPDSSSALVCSTGILDSSSALVSSTVIPDSSSALVCSTGIPDSSSALVCSTGIPDSSSALELAQEEINDEIIEIDELSQMCHQCCRIRMCKFKLHIAGKPRYLCQDDCFNIFKKGGDYLVTRKPQHRSSGAHDSNRADADLGLVRKCAQCALAITPDDKTLSWETMDFCNEECLGKGCDPKFEGIRLTSDATVEVHILAGHIADSFPHNHHQRQLCPAFGRITLVKCFLFLLCSIGKFQTQLGSHCANCKGSVQPTSLGKYCVRFGYDIKQFCCSTCLEEFKKGLKVCSYCQKDISKSDGFLAPVGDKGQFKDFCTQACMEKYDQMSNNLPPPVSTAQCAVCNNEKVVKIEVQLDNKIQKLCSPPCFAAFKFVNKLNADKCDMCKKYFDKKKVENFSVFYDDSPHNFCCKTCMNVYILANRKIVPCNWCKVKKYNFDMIKRVVSSGQILMMCSLNCLTLYKVSINAVSSKRIKCDMCNGVAQAQYHLTMSDATVRNFCSYQCVMQFQGQYSKSPPLTFSGSEPAPVPTGGPKKVYPRRSVPVNQTESQANSQIVADKKTTGSDSMCVISEVQSLAPNGQPAPPNTPRSATHKVNNIPQSVSVTTNNQQGSMFKQQVIVKPPPPKVMRNKAVNCKPYMHTKGVSCRPHPCTKETQTDDSMGKPVLIPIPVPIYIPAPMHMYSSPFPVPVPFPLPVPVPIFVPTTRNSITGIIKEIKRIQEKIPTDPFEAELLMMAEMVADEKKADNSDSDSDDAGPDAGDASEVPRAMHAIANVQSSLCGNTIPNGFCSPSASSAAEGDFSPEAVDTSNTFGEDMLQMALKMASELEEPAVDLEAALTPSTITAQSNTSMEQNDESEDDPEPVHVPERASYRGRKRTLRSSSQRGGASKRGRRASSTVDVPLLPPPEPTPPPRIEQEKPDANMCLKVSSSGSCLHANMCLKVSSSGSCLHANICLKVSTTGSCLHANICLKVSGSGSCLHANMCLKYTFGVNAWKHWVQSKNAELEKAATNNRKLKLFKPEILQLTADELNYSLCLFVKEVRKPNGQEYAPDTIYYLCLGIQQYLFENGRIDNIFTDSYYEKFTECLDEVARKFTALYNDSHYIVTRVEEEHLWESKQLGAHSPHVLLSTLLFFNTKHFNLTANEHMQLSFSHIMKHWKRNPNLSGGAKLPGPSRNVLLRFYPPQSALDGNSKKKKVYEQQENEENPLSPESVKTRNDVFYLLPERSCVPDSPVWYSTMALGKEPLIKMLNRVKMVKEINIALLSS
uniref:TRASH domain-containing protein n=3 Tax=Timema TaxID=61471 RepID=A0A7R9JWE1_TIMGE|nr:unnamed protein product [Timema genevievae]